MTGERREEWLTWTEKRKLIVHSFIYYRFSARVASCDSKEMQVKQKHTHLKKKCRIFKHLGNKIKKNPFNKSTENPTRLCVRVVFINSITYSTLQRHYMNSGSTQMSTTRIHMKRIIKITNVMSSRLPWWFPVEEPVPKILSAFFLPTNKVKVCVRVCI